MITFKLYTFKYNEKMLIFCVTHLMNSESKGMPQKIRIWCVRLFITFALLDEQLITANTMETSQNSDNTKYKQKRMTNVND